MESGSAAEAGDTLSPKDLDTFRALLMLWYRTHARVLPWRGTKDPYTIWVSEVMLQQTRVAAVIEHFKRFMRLFPTISALAEASEEQVLAAWSGLGYYRRARMLHRAARFCIRELEGRVPETSAELRKLPGVGDYTCAAIASIGFGESIAVVDGNVERVLLRVAGRAEDKTAAGQRFVRDQAARLLPSDFQSEGNFAGDHNQAMMELGATICLPRNPLCLNCPVFGLCRTRGEHGTNPRGKQRRRRIACLLATRRKGQVREVLLERRAADASLMPGMLELPALPLDSLDGHETRLHVRHSITHTNYAVEVYADPTGRGLIRAVLAAKEVLCWAPVERLAELPLTGLARKVVRRLFAAPPC